MKRALAALGVMLAVLAPLPARAADVAVLKSADTLSWRPAIEALRHAAPNHTITEYDFKNDRAEGERVLGTLKGKPLVLVAMGPLAAQLGRSLLPESPMVFCMVQDPGKLGLLGVPNVTGVAFTIPVKNQLAAFRMVNPKGVRVGVIYNEENMGKVVEEALKAAGLVRLLLVAKPVPSEKEIPASLRALLAGDDAVDAIWLLPDPILLGEDSRRYLLAETLKAGKPVYTFATSIVNEGALVSNGPDYASIGEEAADLVNRVAGGDKAKLEMLVPKAELTVNKKIAGKLKIEIPADVLKLASKVF